MSSKYTIDISVIGNVNAKMNNIGKSLSKVCKQTDRCATSAEDASGKMNEMASSSKAVALMEIAGAAQRAGDMFLGMSSKIVEFGNSFVDSIVRDRATFEDAEASMRFAFGEDKWKGMFEKVKSEAADLTFMFSETLDLAASMGRIDVNPFGTTAENLNVFKAKTGQMVSAFQVLQDTADGTSRSAGSIALGVKNALGGQFRMLKNAADIGPTLFQEWKDDIKAASTQQEKYNVLIQKLATQFGGAGALRADNFNKVMAQIPDLFEILRAAIGKTGLRKITEAVKDLVDTLTDLTKNKEFIAAMSDGFVFLAESIAKGIRFTAKMIEVISAFIAKHPGIVKVAMIVAALTAGFLALAGVILTVVAIMLGLAAVFSMISAGSLFMTLQVIAVAIGLIATGAAAVAAIFKGAFQDPDFTNVTDSLSRIGVLLTAAWEIASSFKDGFGEVSEATKRNVERMGLTDLLINVASLINAVMGAVERLGQGFSHISEMLQPAISKTWTDILLAVQAVAVALGFTQSAADQTSAWAGAVDGLLGFVLMLAEGLLQVVQFAANVIEDMANWGIIGAVVSTISSAINIMIGAIRIAWPLLRAMFYGLAITFAPILITLYLIVKAVEILVDALVWVAEAIGMIDEPVKRVTKSVGGMQKAGSQVAGKFALTQAQMDQQSTQSILGMGGLPAGAPAQGFVPGKAPVMMPPSHVLPPTNYGSTAQPQGQDNEAVVMAQGETRDAVLSLTRRIAEQPPPVINVMLDGQEIGAVINSNAEGKS